jgi:hypothetical protein
VSLSSHEDTSVMQSITYGIECFSGARYVGLSSISQASDLEGRAKALPKKQLNHLKLNNKWKKHTSFLQLQKLCQPEADLSMRDSKGYHSLLENMRSVDPRRHSRHCSVSNIL